MGIVYRARDERLRRDVAVKVLASGSSELDRDRLRHEALSLSKLNHPNIATVFDFDSADGTDFLVVELIEGSTLDKQLQLPMPEEKAINLCKQVAEGLAAAHGNGIIHRDLKPGNIALTTDGRVKLLDFGLARPLPSAEISVSTATTLGHEIAGTLPYMAPEQLQGKSVDVRSDLYALGVVLYELLTGRMPYKVNTSAEVAGAIIHKTPESPRLHNPDISAGMEQIVLKCLEKDPELRYQSAKDVGIDLRRISDRPTTPIAPITVTAPRNRWPWIVSVALCLALLCALVGYRLLRPGSAQPNSLVVLPLTDREPDPAQAYLADAIGEEITNALTGLKSLRVISHATASRYRQPTRRIPEIAKELDVDAVMSGYVVRSASKIEVSLELVDGRTDRRLWSRKYERTLSDVASLQREIASDVVREIKVAVSPEEQERLATLPTSNPAAYDAFLRGQYYARDIFHSREDTQKVLESAAEAVRLDPNFAEAYVLYAHGCQAMVFMWNGGKEMDEKSMVAVNKALSLNPGLADAYDIRGNIYYTELHRFDLARSIADHQKATKLNPNSSAAHHHLGQDLTHLGLHDLAIRELDLAAKLDPQLNGPRFRKARVLWQSNRFKEALEEYERMNYEWFERAIVLGYLGRQKEAKGFLERTSVNPKNSTYGDSFAGRAFISALEGARSEVDRNAEMSVKLGKGNDHFHHAAFVLACAYAEIGNAPKAVEWLRRTADGGMPNYPLMKDNPSMQKLHGNPEYELFMRELKVRFDDIAAVLEK